MPSQILKGHTPILILSLHRDPYSLLPQVFSYLCFAHNCTIDDKKLDNKATKIIFLGCSPTQKGYKCLDPKKRK